MKILKDLNVATTWEAWHIPEKNKTSYVLKLCISDILLASSGYLFLTVPLDMSPFPFYVIERKEESCQTLDKYKELR